MLLKALPKEIKERLALPVIAAPMFLVSNPVTVIEGCKAGIISSFPSLNARTAADFEDWLIEINEQVDQAAAPWAVNLIVHKTNNRYQTDLELIKKYKVPIVITSLGNPAATINHVHEYGGLVFSDVSTIKHARKTAEAGVDGIILVCAGAGGHGGVINPFAFIQQVRTFWDGIIILAGGMSTGQDILAAQILGADLAYMGTRFISAGETSVSEDYRAMLIDSEVEDIFYTDAFTGVNGNYLIPSIEKAGLSIEQLEKKAEMDFTDKSKRTGKAWKDIWSAGHGVGRTKEVQSMKEIIAELKQEFEQAKQQV